MPVAPTMAIFRFCISITPTNILRKSFMFCYHDKVDKFFVLHYNIESIAYFRRFVNISAREIL